MKRLLNVIIILGLLVGLCQPPMLVAFSDTIDDTSTELSISIVDRSPTFIFAEDSNHQHAGSVDSDDEDSVRSPHCAHGHGACAISSFSVINIVTADEQLTMPAIIYHNPPLSLEVPPPRLWC